MLQATLSHRPWYREFWPWFLMALPATAVVAGFITLWLAIESADGLVADDYYKQGLAINRTLARDERAAHLHLEGQLQLSGGQAALTLTGQAALPPQLILRVLHPTRAGMDQMLFLTNRGNGHFTGQVRLPAPADWEFVLGDEAKTWLLRGRFANSTAQIVSLKPGV